MLTREKLLRSDTYHTVSIQNELFSLVDEYLTETGVSQEVLAKAANMSRKRLKRILDGDFNGPLSQLVNTSLAVGKVPVVQWVDLESYISEDAARQKAAVAKRQHPESILKTGSGE